MSSELDELFGEGSGTPTPRTRLVRTLLGVGLALAVLGMTCSAAPGGLVVLAAWLLVDTETRRVENGYLPADAGPEVARVRRQVLVGLNVVLLLFLVQSALVCGGFYDRFWTWAIGAFADAFGLRA